MPNKKEKQANEADLFFSLEEEKRARQKKWEELKPQFLLSSDSLPGYWLDLVFELTKDAGFDGIDLALRKNFDARNVRYVKKLVAKYELPVKTIQTSGNINEKEMNKALDLCYELNTDTIAINAPSTFSIKAFNFLVDNLWRLKKENKNIHFAIINPEDSNIFALPIPKYRFSNMVEIIKKYGCYLGLDIANMDSGAFENDFMRKMKEFLPYIATIYLSDKTKLGDGHILPGEGTLKIPSFLKKLKEHNFRRYITIKLEISKTELSDGDKMALILKKARKYLQENYEEMEID